MDSIVLGFSLILKKRITHMQKSSAIGRRLPIHIMDRLGGRIEVITITRSDTISTIKNKVQLQTNIRLNGDDTCLLFPRECVQIECNTDKLSPQTQLMSEQSIINNRWGTFIDEPLSDYTLTALGIYDIEDNITILFKEHSQQYRPIIAVMFQFTNNSYKVFCDPEDSLERAINRLIRRNKNFYSSDATIRINITNHLSTIFGKEYSAIKIKDFLPSTNLDNQTQQQVLLLAENLTANIKEEKESYVREELNADEGMDSDHNQPPVAYQKSPKTITTLTLHNFNDNDDEMKEGQQETTTTTTVDDTWESTGIISMRKDFVHSNYDQRLAFLSILTEKAQEKVNDYKAKATGKSFKTFFSSGSRKDSYQDKYTKCNSALQKVTIAMTTNPSRSILIDQIKNLITCLNEPIDDACTTGTDILNDALSRSKDGKNDADFLKPDEYQEILKTAQNAQTAFNKN